MKRIFSLYIVECVLPCLCTRYGRWLSLYSVFCKTFRQNKWSDSIFKMNYCLYRKLMSLSTYSIKIQITSLETNSRLLSIILTILRIFQQRFSIDQLFFVWNIMTAEEELELHFNFVSNTVCTLSYILNYEASCLSLNKNGNRLLYFF